MDPGDGVVQFIGEKRQCRFRCKRYPGDDEFFSSQTGKAVKFQILFKLTDCFAGNSGVDRFCLTAERRRRDFTGLFLEKGSKIAEK